MKIYLTLGSHKIRLLLIMTLLAIFLTSLYLPLILGGGIIADDWGDISQTLNCANFFECYLSWFPLFSNRPVAPLPITTATLLFKTNFSWYLILNTTIYLLSLFIIGNLLRKILGTFPALIFIILGSIPMILALGKISLKAYASIPLPEPTIRIFLKSFLGKMSIDILVLKYDILFTINYYGISCIYS